MKVQHIKVQQRFDVQAPVQTVWDFLRDASTFSLCVPGIEQIEVFDEKNFGAVIKVKIALISARFKIALTVTEEEPPTHLVSVVKGEDNGNGTAVEMKSFVDLEPSADGGTTVSYSTDTALSGKLAALGGGIAVKLKAVQLGKEFAREVKKRVE